MVKKFGAIFLTVLLFCCMSVPAMAADSVEQEVTIDLFSTIRANTSREWLSDITFMTPRIGDQSPLYRFDLFTDSGEEGWSLEGFSQYDSRVRHVTLTAEEGQGFIGTVAFYISFYFANQDNNGPAWRMSDFFQDIYSVTVTDSKGEIITTSNIEAEIFEPDSSPWPNTSQGITWKCEFQVDESNPFVNLDFSSYNWNAIIDTTYTGVYGFFVPSCTFITGRTSEEVKALEELTEVIIEQNNISNQYYSNVINKVEQIYNEVNNIQELQQEVINRMDEFNEVTSIPGSVTTKTEQAAQLITGLEGLEKPDPEQIVPDLTVDTTEISQVLGAFFQNALIMQVLLMSLGFCLVSYVLYGKK